MTVVARAFEWFARVLTGPSIAPPEPQDPPVSFDLAFDLLANPRRRGVIDQLAATDDDALGIKPVAVAIAKQEAGVTDVHPSHDAYKTVYTSLLQSHLPRLDNAGVVEFDTRRTEIRRGPAFAFIADLQREARASFGGETA